MQVTLCLESIVKDMNWRKYTKLSHKLNREMDCKMCNFEYNLFQLILVLFLKCFLKG